MIKSNPIIVCAAMRHEGFIVCGARHFDMIMHGQVEYYKQSKKIVEYIKWEQGFIDQFGEFHTREDAMNIVKKNGQPFNLERNGGHSKILFSEGLY